MTVRIVGGSASTPSHREKAVKPPIHSASFPVYKEAARSFTAVSTHHGIGRKITMYGIKDIARVEENLALVRAHFGTNVSDSLRISLHLTAQAIRQNKALPEV